MINQQYAAAVLCTNAAHDTHPQCLTTAVADEQGGVNVTEPTTRTTNEERCPMCGEPVADSPYPRHRLVLEDESDTGPNQRHERRVCPTCWDDLRETLASPM